ncbi:Hypothetical predicted protein [Paramuricea clavata]|uniref:Uncharacterized protein n=1 Tax=Paramuricea clavata TaxID=317549 RepID=A0A6S7IGP0_PARCT|nr:Hypothetical predicted protein [Paramuricea clavata]
MEMLYILKGYEYLMKWKGWSLETSTWEPSQNVSPDLLRNYEEPPITNETLQVASSQFACGVTSAFWSRRSALVYITINLDVWRYVVFQKGVPSEHRGHHLFEMEDFG